MATINNLENGYNKVQINSTIDMDATDRIIKKSLMLNIRTDDVKTACELYEELKRKIESKEENLNKKTKKEKGKEKEEAKKEPERIKTPTCDCGSPMMFRNGKWGSFWSCSAYPLCRLTKPYQEKKSLPIANQDLIDVENIPF